MCGQTDAALACQVWDHSEMKMERSSTIREKIVKAFMLTLAFCAICVSSTQLHAETVFANLEQVSGWESCTVCAGAIRGRRDG